MIEYDAPSGACYTWVDADDGSSVGTCDASFAVLTASHDYAVNGSYNCILKVTHTTGQQEIIADIVEVNLGMVSIAIHL